MRGAVRRLAFLASAGVFAAFAGSSTVFAQEPAPEIIVAGTPNDSGGTIFYAQDLGSFKKAGLNVKIQSMNNPGSVVAAVIGGSVQIGTLAIPGLAIARQKGVPI